MEFRVNLMTGGKSFGSVGTCWGSYMVMRMSAYPEVTHWRSEERDRH